MPWSERPSNGPASTSIPNGASTSPASLSTATPFSRNWHVSPAHLQSFPDRPLVLGVDPGLNPAVLVTQLSPIGQLRVLREFHAPNLLFRDFLNTLVMPELQTVYPLHNMLWVMDPAGDSRSAMSNDTAMGVLKSYGFAVHTATTNDLQPRLRAVERWLLQAGIGGLYPWVRVRAGLLRTWPAGPADRPPLHRPDQGLRGALPLRPRQEGPGS